MRIQQRTQDERTEQVYFIIQGYFIMQAYWVYWDCVYWAFQKCTTPTTTTIIDHSSVKLNMSKVMSKIENTVEYNNPFCCKTSIGLFEARQYQFCPVQVFLCSQENLHIIQVDGIVALDEQYAYHRSRF